MMYNPAFDPFNGIYRMLNILRHFGVGEIIEVDRLRIYDFYLLFPYKTYQIRFKRTEENFRKRLTQYVEKKENPYNTSSNDRRLFERLRPYQMIALSHLASYGLISPSQLLEYRVKIIDYGKMQQVLSQLEMMPAAENNIISWLCYCFRATPLNGNYGLKYRTKLLKSKYDGC